MIDNYRLNKFDNYFDSYMSIADKILAIKKNSNDFLLTDYEEQEEFYSDFETRFQFYVDLFKDKVKNLEQYQIEEYSKIIKVQESYEEYGFYTNLKDTKWENFLQLSNNIIFIIQAIIEEEKKQKTLDFYIMLFSYINILYIIEFIDLFPHFLDRYSRESRIHVPAFGGMEDFGMSTYVYGYSLICLWPNDEIYISKFNSKTVKNFIKKNRDNTKVPFTSPRGIYGFNTFSTLWYNDLHPIGISHNHYPVHNGTYVNEPFYAICHDFGHASTVPDSIKYDNIEEINKIKSEYICILKNQEILGEERTKDFLMLIFDTIHESGFADLCKKSYFNSGNEFNRFLLEHRYASNFLEGINLSDYKNGLKTVGFTNFISSHIMQLISVDYALVMRNINLCISTTFKIEDYVPLTDSDKKFKYAIAKW